MSHILDVRLGLLETLRLEPRSVDSTTEDEGEAPPQQESPLLHMRLAADGPQRQTELDADSEEEAPIPASRWRKRVTDSEYEAPISASRGRKRVAAQADKVEVSKTY